MDEIKNWFYDLLVLWHFILLCLDLLNIQATGIGRELWIGWGENAFLCIQSRCFFLSSQKLIGPMLLHSSIIFCLVDDTHVLSPLLIDSTSSKFLLKILLPLLIFLLIAFMFSIKLRYILLSLSKVKFSSL